jgi:hypothetical protein
MDYGEFMTLWQIITVLHAEDEVAKELGIKTSSLKRQVSRIEAYYAGKPVQRRSGLKRGEDYINAMRRVAERRLGQPVLTQFIPSPRQVRFSNLWDLIRYREPIAHISSIRYMKGDDVDFPWELTIAINSSVV